MDGFRGTRPCRQTVSSYISIVSDALAIALNITGAEIVPVAEECLAPARCFPL